MHFLPKFDIFSDYDCDPISAIDNRRKNPITIHNDRETDIIINSDIIIKPDIIIKSDIIIKKKKL